MPLTPPTMTPTVVIPPFNEAVRKTLRLRTAAEIQSFPYLLNLSTSVSLATKVRVTAQPSIAQVPITVFCRLAVSSTLVSPGSWTPSALSPTAWYDASQSSDFTLISGTVSQWNDRSGNARHLTQGTAGSRPAYASATLNSLNLVTFDGTNDFLSGTTLNNCITAASHTVMAVFRQRGATTTGANTYDNKAVISDQEAYFGLFVNAPSGTSSTRIMGYNWDGSDDNVIQTIGADNAWSIAVFTHGSGSIGMTRNGGTLATASSGSTLDLTFGLDVGRNLFANFFLEMDLAEIVILNTAVGTTDRQKLEGYAAHKWGRTADLPSDHPYKTSAP
jgi:hypothetical protein